MAGFLPYHRSVQSQLPTLDSHRAEGEVTSRHRGSINNYAVCKENGKEETEETCQKGQKAKAKSQNQVVAL
jgi:hypothetical protein